MTDFSFVAQRNFQFKIMISILQKRSMKYMMMQRSIFDIVQGSFAELRYIARGFIRCEIMQAHDLFHGG